MHWSDATLHCAECSARFVLTAGEREIRALHDHP
jgi:hypothetical protein